jgi:hypothetical protein
MADGYRRHFKQGFQKFQVPGLTTQTTKHIRTLSEQNAHKKKLKIHKKFIIKCTFKKR